MFEGIPEWLGTGIVGAVGGVLGYLGKMGHDSLKARSKRHAATVRQLEELSSMLRESWSLFVLQNYQAQRLHALLKSNHPTGFPEDVGYDRTFATLFPKYTPEERELHDIIRSTTENSILRVNEAMREWVRKDTTFIGASARGEPWATLAAKLDTLRDHLNLWHAKYQTWIPGHPEHALVYMADEDQHGVGFPSRIEDDVVAVLGELQ